MKNGISGIRVLQVLWIIRPCSKLLDVFQVFEYSKFCGSYVQQDDTSPQAANKKQRRRKNKVMKGSYNEFKVVDITIVYFTIYIFRIIVSK